MLVPSTRSPPNASCAAKGLPRPPGSAHSVSQRQLQLSHPAPLTVSLPRLSLHDKPFGTMSKTELEPAHCPPLLRGTPSPRPGLRQEPTRSLPASLLPRTSEQCPALIHTARPRCLVTVLTAPYPLPPRRSLLSGRTMFIHCLFH